MTARPPHPRDVLEEAAKRLRSDQWTLLSDARHLAARCTAALAHPSIAEPREVATGALKAARREIAYLLKDKEVLIKSNATIWQIDRALAEQCEAARASQPAEVTGDRREQVARAVVNPGNWNGHGKYGTYFGFDKGGLSINQAGYGEGDGSGHLVFKDADLEFEQDDGPLYRYVNLPKSELLYIRDALNKVFPEPDPLPLPAADDAGWREAASIERLRRILARYGDRVPMAMCHRPDWQQEIDDALAWVAANPEPVFTPQESGT